MDYETLVELRNDHGGTFKIKITTEGATFAEIEAAVHNLGCLPTRIVGAASKKVAQKVRRGAKGIAPKRTGELRSGIVVSKKRERTRKRGHVVWDVWMDNTANDVFQKTSPGTRAGYAYYPASMEYGFRQRDGKHYDGFFYLKSAADAFEGEHEALTLGEIKVKLDQLWEKKQKLPVPADGGD